MMEFKYDDERDEVIVYMSIVDINAGLMQTAKIAESEGFKNVAERCGKYVDTLRLARNMQSAIASDRDPHTFPTIVIRCD